MGLMTEYLQYYEATEIPQIYSRWSLLSILGANSGSSVYFNFGGKHIRPNLYVMLMGPSGARKSTAIEKARDLLRTVSGVPIAASKTSKEKFIEDLAGVGNAFVDEEATYEVAVLADEGNEFFGLNNIEFLSMLGSLWDTKRYDYKTRGGVSVEIHNPVVSILSGNTPTNFSKAFPPEIIGQGFFSRLIIVYGKESSNRVAFPADMGTLEHFIDIFQKIQIHCNGEMKFTPEAKAAATELYENWVGYDDPRFESFGQRRHTHLIKLCMCVALSKQSMEMDLDTLIEANTYLTHVEVLMPKALGEFGRARNSALAHQVLTAVEAIFKNSCVPVDQVDIWRAVAQDVESRSQLSEILRNLQDTRKIVSVDGKILPQANPGVDRLRSSKFVNLNLLTEQERQL